MDPRQLCEEYLAALNAGSIESVLALFEPDAVVDSPLYGTMPVAPFYVDLFGDTNRSQTRLLHVFNAAPDASGACAVALHFHYRWTLKNGREVEFECVDVFELNADLSRFSRLKIIYDTAPIRSAFEEVHS